MLDVFITGSSGKIIYRKEYAENHHSPNPDDSSSLYFVRDSMDSVPEQYPGSFLELF
jgi:hypothetical protein